MPVALAEPGQGGTLPCIPSYRRLQLEGCGEWGWGVTRSPGYPGQVENLLQVAYQKQRAI